jgi:hypothetical protein
MQVLTGNFVVVEPDDYRFMESHVFLWLNHGYYDASIRPAPSVVIELNAGLRTVPQ